MQIQGIEGLTPDQLRAEVRAGGRFVIYSYCVSVVIMTFRRPTDVYFLRAGESGAGKSLPWTLISLFLGWWGFPFGLVYTPLCIIENLGGGKNVTDDILRALQLEAIPAPVLAGAPGQPGAVPPRLGGVGAVPPPFGAPGSAAGGIEGGAAGSGTVGSAAGGAASGTVGGAVSGDPRAGGRSEGDGRSSSAWQGGSFGVTPGAGSGAPTWQGEGGARAISGAPTWQGAGGGVAPAGRSDPLATQAGWSLGLGVASMACCAPLGWVGAVLGVLSLKRARELGRPAPGKAVAGLVLSALSTLLLLASVSFMVQDIRARDAKKQAALAKVATGRTQLVLTRATACGLIEAALLDGLYGSEVSFKSVRCDTEPSNHGTGAKLERVTADWDDSMEKLDACFAWSTRWYLLSIGPGLECPISGPKLDGPWANDAALTEAELRAQAMNKPDTSKKQRKTARIDSLRGTSGAGVQVAMNEDDDQPRLELDVLAVYRSHKPSDAAPFHVAGGDWSYFDVAVRGQPDAKATIGTRVGKGAGFISFGDATLVATDSEAGAKFVEAFADAFHVDVPSRANPATPLEPLSFRTAVLAQDVDRLEGGGFGGEPGDWTATKWFPSRDGELEVFFNYDLVGRRAELTEKDEGYAQDLARAFATALRDGPRPPRTPLNDKTLAPTGPRFEGWKRVAEGHVRSWPQPARLLFVGKQKNGEALMALDFATGATRELCRVEHVIDQVEDTGARVLVLEALPSEEGARSSTDPTRLLLCQKGKGELITFATVLPRVELLSSSLSPDGRFLSVGIWKENKDGEGQHREVLLRDNEWKTETTLKGGDDSYDVVGWRTEEGGLVVELEKGFAFEPPQTRAAFDYLFAERKRVPVTRPLHTERDVKQDSPGGQRFSVEEGKALVVITAGKERRLELHPEDQRFVAEGAFGWLDERYLRFDAARPALIDTTTMQVWFPLPAKEDAELHYSADFRAVVKSNDEGTFVGRVVLPK